MSTVEAGEKNQLKLTFEVSPERFQEGLKHSYNKNKNNITIQGFRKGKAPRKIIERNYGKEFFYDDAINFVLPDAYEAALAEHQVEPVYRPDIEINEANEETGASFVATVYIKPEVSVDGYYGLTYPKPDLEPTPSDIQEKLQVELDKNARLISSEQPAKNGDTLTINFVGFVDGIPFEGGAGRDYSLTLGTHTFIDTFEDQLVGHSVGDDVEVKVTFPTEYGHTELAGKAAVFQVEVLDIKTKEYPEVNDEFAQDVSEFETLAEYRQSLSDKIKEEKKQQAEMIKQKNVMTQLTGKAVMDVPEVMYKAQTEEMLQDFMFRLRMQGIAPEQYFEYTQTTPESMKKDYEKSAKEIVDGRLALEAVAAKEALSVSEEDFQSHIAEMAERSAQTAEDILARFTPERTEEAKKDLLVQKALDFVMEKAVAVDENGN